MYCLFLKTPKIKQRQRSKKMSRIVKANASTKVRKTEDRNRSDKTKFTDMH